MCDPTLANENSEHVPQLGPIGGLTQGIMAKLYSFLKGDMVFLLLLDIVMYGCGVSNCYSYLVTA